MLAVVSDGAGSASRSDESSKLAVSTFIGAFAPRTAEDPTLQFCDRSLVENWLNDFRDQLAALELQNGNEIREFSCTFLAAIVGPQSAVCIQIGDGAIVGSDEEPGDYAWLTWPQHGEFANTTNFLTDDDVFETMAYEFIDRSLREVAVFSDGLERLILDIGSHCVHSAALRPIFEWLTTMPPSLEYPSPEPALEAFLGSSRINERTDDDKTLVMATRAVNLGKGNS
jgi:hypothetical protein